MLRKWTAWTLIVLSLVMVFTACTGQAEPVKTQAPSVEPQDTQEAINSTQQVEAQQEEKVGDMLPVLDSIIRAMSEPDGVYAPKEAEFFWTVLYLAVVNYGEQSGHAEMTEDGQLKAARQAVQEIASACFEDYDDLLDIPEGLMQSVIYDESEDAYLFAASDIGDSYSEITDMSAQGDAISVTVALKSGDDAQYYVFVLIENPYASSISEPTFYFTVRDADKIDD